MTVRTKSEVKADIVELLKEKSLLDKMWLRKENNPIDYEIWEMRMEDLREELKGAR